MDSIINVLQSIFRPHKSNAQNVKSKEYDGQALLAARKRVGTPGRVYVQNKMDEMGIKDRAYELELYNQYDKRKQTSGFYPWEAKAELDGITPTPEAAMVQAPAEQVMGASTGGIDPQVQNFLEKTVFPITRQYGIPDEIAAGQFAAEGRLQGLGAERNNFYNINAIDSNPDAAYGYKDPESGVDAYARLLTKNKRYSGALQEGLSSEEMLDAIERAGYAGEPKTYKKRAKNGFNSYSDFIENTPEYRHYKSR